MCQVKLLAFIRVVSMLLELGNIDWITLVIIGTPQHVHVAKVDCFLLLTKTDSDDLAIWINSLEEVDIADHFVMSLFAPCCLRVSFSQSL